MHLMQRMSVPVDDDLLNAVDRAAEQQGTSRAKVLAEWLQTGYRAAGRDALSDAYDEFYGEGDPEPVPREVQRARAARFDAKWM